MVQLLYQSHFPVMPIRNKVRILASSIPINTISYDSIGSQKASREKGEMEKNLKDLQWVYSGKKN